MEIVSAENRMPQAKELIREYTDSLGRNLDFQHLSDELEHPERKYSPPHGKMLLAMAEGKAVGCVAYTVLSPRRCEMKRLYVKPQYRKLHAGQKLIERIIALAKEDGFEEMVLDTLEPMKAARALYASCGFEEIGPYYANPFGDVIYMGLKLK